MSIKAIPKKRGRPATGKDPTVTVRLPEVTLTMVEACAAAEGKARSAVIREALDQYLVAKGYLRRPS